MVRNAESEPFVLNLRIIFFFSPCISRSSQHRVHLNSLVKNLTFLISLVDSMLKLSKLDLTEDRTSGHQEVIEDSKAGGSVSYTLFKNLCQDVFIGRREQSQLGR